MSINTSYAHGASGAVAVQGYAATATAVPSPVTLAVKSWKVTETKKLEDSSNTGTTGFTAVQAGKKTAKITIEAQLPLATSGTAYDETHNPISSAGPDLQADYCTATLVGGTTQGASAVTVTGTPATTLYAFPCLVMDSFEINNSEGDLISYTINATSSGTYTVNAGS